MVGMGIIPEQEKVEKKKVWISLLAVISSQFFFFVSTFSTPSSFPHFTSSSSLSSPSSLFLNPTWWFIMRIIILRWAAGASMVFNVLILFLLCITGTGIQTEVNYAREIKRAVLSNSLEMFILFALLYGNSRLGLNSKKACLHSADSHTLWQLLILIWVAYVWYILVEADGGGGWEMSWEWRRKGRRCSTSSQLLCWPSLVAINIHIEYLIKTLNNTFKTFFVSVLVTNNSNIKSISHFMYFLHLVNNWLIAMFGM